MSNLQVNALVKVKDNYAGGLSGVIGRTGRIIRIQDGNYLLDIEGSREVGSYYGQDPYVFQYSVVAKADELETVDIVFKDCNGRQIEIGDTIVYSGNRSGFLQAKVVKFKIGEDSPWSARPDVVKCQVEYTEEQRDWDGGDRRVPRDVAKRLWLEHSDRFYVVSKPYIFGGIIGNQIHLPGL